MNVFVDDCEALEALPELDERPGKASKDLMIYQDFVNQKYTQGKKVSSLNWHPTIHGKKTKQNKTRNQPLLLEAATMWLWCVSESQVSAICARIIFLYSCFVICGCRRP